jgi:hypothetical protein
MKKLITLFEASSSDFRAKLTGLGYSEKGSELTSGGDLNPQFLDILSSILDEWKKSNPNCPLKFTSGNDAFHKTRKSLHTVGLAVDVTFDGSCKPNFLSLLDSYKTKYNGFSYIDEYAHPSPGATGGHIHISFRTGSPEPLDSSYQSSESGSGTTDSTSSSTGGDDLDTRIDNQVKGTLTNLATGVGKVLNAATGIGVQSESKNKRISEQINRIKGLM